MLDSMAPVTVLSPFFQTEKVDVVLIKVCKTRFEPKTFNQLKKSHLTVYQLSLKFNIVIVLSASH